MGGALKSKVEFVRNSLGDLQSKDDLEYLIWWCVQCQNRHPDRSGLSVDQHVLGFTLRTSRSKTSGDMMNPEQLEIVDKTGTMHKSNM